MPPRRKKTGGLYQRAADGMWCAVVELPSEGGTGRRRKVIARARKDEALAALNKLRDELERAGDLATSSPTLATWLDLWYARSEQRIKVSTRPTYRSKIDNYIVPAIGRVRLDKLSAQHIHRLHDFVRVDLGLSSTTALQAHRVLAKALTDAEREGRVSRNVAKMVDAPRKNIVKIPHLSNEQHKSFVRATGERDQSMASRWIVAFQAGLRPGERLGLTADEVMFGRHVIRVAWQLQRLTFVHGCEGTCGRSRGGNCPTRRLDVPGDQEVRHLEGGLYLTRPKSRAGWREVPMTEAVEATLRWHLGAHPPGQEGLIFTRDGSRPIDPSDDAKEWKTALGWADLPHVRRHSSRHTCATVLDELGVPDNVRQLIIGHADKETTAMYTHVADERAHAAMARLGEAMRY